MANIKEAFNDDSKLLNNIPREVQNKKQNEYQLYNYYQHIKKPIFEVPIDAYYRPSKKKVAIENQLRYSELNNTNKYSVMEQTTSGRGQILLDDPKTLPKNIPFLVTTSLNENPNAVEKYNKYGMNTRDFGRKKSQYYKQTNDKHASEENYFV